MELNESEISGNFPLKLYQWNINGFDRRHKKKILTVRNHFYSQFQEFEIHVENDGKIIKWSFSS